MAERPLDVRTTSDGVCTVTLNRPEVHNALDETLIRTLHETVIEQGASLDTRVMVLTGAGKSFCAGGDLNWMRAQFSATREERIAQALRLARMLAALNTAPMPVIARVNGSAFGGGVGLVCTADHVVATTDCRFALTETRLGLIPATISPFVSARLGEASCRSRYLFAERFGAEAARRSGLVDEAVAPDALDTTVQRVVEAVLQGSPDAQRRAKRLARSQGMSIDAVLLEHCAEALADCWESDDAVEGVGAFFEKRAPAWRGP